ncbi:MAG: aminotransferase class I/II-fold pyridoxal phosphate-dependent enzyme [Kiloniellales bacterium]|nr:aminotransferase class I/II-fold pyridoxal phosphate-dependent enzyme [Kiloniellales bacterium]
MAVDILEKFAPIQGRHDELLAAGADPFGVCMDDIVSPSEAIVNGRKVILFGTNNYLGLTFDKDCIEAAVDALRKFGTGTTGSRIANGTYRLHTDLEDAFARFFDRKYAMIFPSGFQANLGCLAGVAGPKDTLYLDADSHASLYDGSIISRAKIVRFRHNDPADLDRRLGRHKDSDGGKVVVLESLYSMFGDVAPLEEFIRVCKSHDAVVILDEAHSFGVYGEKGQGLAYQLGLNAQVDFIVGTYSKSLGAVGGFIVSDHPRFEALRYTCRQYMFTASSLPSSLASVRTALEKVAEGVHLRRSLWQNAKDLHDQLRALGFQICAPVSPIIAVRLPDERAAVAMWNGLLDQGVYVNLALPPGTPENTHLLRCSVSAALEPSQLETILATFETVGRKLGIIGSQAA